MPAVGRSTTTSSTCGPSSGDSSTSGRASATIVAPRSPWRTLGVPGLPDRDHAPSSRRGPVDARAERHRARPARLVRRHADRRCAASRPARGKRRRSMGRASFPGRNRCRSARATTSPSRSGPTSWARTTSGPGTRTCSTAVPPGRPKAQFRQSTFLGQLLSREALKRRLPDHVPTLKEEGRLLRFVLDQMETGLSAADHRPRPLAALSIVGRRRERGARARPGYLGPVRRLRRSSDAGGGTVPLLGPDRRVGRRAPGRRVRCFGRQ